MGRTGDLARVVGGAVAVCLILVVAGCGTSTGASSPASAAATPDVTAPSTATAPTSASSGALTGEAASASVGDIPDNQVFLTVNDKTLGFSMRYLEGWAQKSTAAAPMNSGKTTRTKRGRLDSGRVAAGVRSGNSRQAAAYTV